MLWLCWLQAICARISLRVGITLKFCAGLSCTISQLIMILVIMALNIGLHGNIILDNPTSSCMQSK